MRSLIHGAAFCVFLLAGAGISGAQTVKSPDAAGIWLGTLPAGQGLRIEFTVVRGNDSALSAVVRSIDQGNAKIQANDVIATEDSLYIGITARAQYAGKLSADGSSVEGMWTQGGMSLPLVLKRQEHALERSHPTILSTREARKVIGIWLGTLSTGGRMRFEFIIARGKDGLLSAVVRNVDKGDVRGPASDVFVTGDSLRVEIESWGVVYAGRIAPGDSTINGAWSQMGNVVPLVLKRQEKPIAAVRVPRRPQMPKKPYPYRAEEVSYENKTAGVKLAGTLTIPKGEGPFPVALLLTGSGQQNRDSELYGHRSFLVLADWLTRQGIAVLRVDDRGVGGSTGNPAVSTTADYADDALAGVAYLKSRPEINSERIGLVGHSEGGTIAQIAASRSKDVAFAVMLAGPGQRLSDVLLAQNGLQVKKQGMGDNSVLWMREKLGTIYGFLADSTSNATAERNIRDYIATLSPEEQQRLALPDVAMQRMFSPWMRYSLRYDPRATMIKISCPVLAINGDRDTQVAAKENLAAISEALAAGGNTHVTVKDLPGLNHLFQTCKTGDVSEYGTIEETMSPVALKTVSDWIRNTCGMGGAVKKK